MKNIDLYAWTSYFLQNIFYIPCRWLLIHRQGLRIKNTAVLSACTKPLLLAVAPHTNAFDIIFVPATLPRHLLPVRWLADRKIFSKWYKNIWFGLWGGVPVGRSLTGRFKGDEESLVLQVLEKKQTAAIFPECCLVGGSFSEIHHRLFSLVINNSIPVVPVNMQGMKTLKTKNLFWKKLNNVCITFGSPIKKDDNQDWSQAVIMSSIMEGFIKIE